MVEDAVTWEWWLFVTMCIAIGLAIGFWLRGVVDRERAAWQDDIEERERARRAAAIHQFEIERAKHRHPSRLKGD